MTIELSDAALVEKIGAGEREAEAELFRRLARRLRLYALRHLRNQDAAADLVQQVLLRALEALRARRLREPEKLASFVLGICRMTMLDLRRGMQRRERLLDRFGSEIPIPGRAPGPSLDHDLLRRCLESLGERERTVLVMTFYAEQSGAEVSEVLGISEANVRTVRHRAILHLRACMGVVA